MYAFWKYDLYPYCLGGKAVKTSNTAGSSPRNRVQIESYATLGSDGKYRGGWFRPFLVLPNSEGRVLKSKLKLLEAQFKEESQELRNKYDARLRKLLKPYGEEKIVK